MKSLSFLAVAGLMFANVASAIYAPNWERPIMGSDLRYVSPTKPVPGFKAVYLTINQRDNSKKPTSFTLKEDNGIRCIVAPCPNIVDTQFKIVSIAPAFHSDAVRYEAVEVLKNIPANVRMAARRMFVTESSMELVGKGGVGFTRRTVWEVEVSTFSQPSKRYYGYPQALASIAME